MSTAARLFLTAVLALLPQTALAAAEDDLWEEGKSFLEPAGITKDVFHTLSVWLEGQYHLGYCDDYLRGSDVAFWRNWWEGTVVVQTEVGRSLLETGTKAYGEGLQDRVSERPSRELCQRVADSWFEDMRKAAEAEPANPEDKP